MADKPEIEGDNPNPAPVDKGLEKELADVEENQGNLPEITPSETPETPPETPATPPEEPPKVETPKPESGKEEEPPKGETPDRPLKYIPIPKWNDLKDKHKKELEGLKVGHEEAMEKLRIELTTATETPEPAPNAADDALKKFAEESGLDEKVVLGLAQVIISQAQLPKETLAKIESITENLSDRQREDADKVEFDTGWDTDIVPLIEEQFPKATKKAVKEIRDQLDVDAHTAELAKTPLKTIFLSKIASGEYKNVLAPPSKKTAETPGSSGGEETPAEGGDYNGLSFVEISKLPEAEHAKIIKSMSSEMFDKYIEGVDKETGASDLIIHRGGQEIRDK